MSKKQSESTFKYHVRPNLNYPCNFIIEQQLSCIIHEFELRTGKQPVIYYNYNGDGSVDNEYLDKCRKILCAILNDILKDYGIPVDLPEVHYLISYYVDSSNCAVVGDINCSILHILLDDKWTDNQSNLLELIRGEF